MPLIAFGHYLPGRQVENEQLEKKLGLPSGWIETRTGIRARYFANDNESLIDIAVKASEMLFDQVSIPKQDIAMVLLATSTPDHLLPPSAPLLAHRLQLNHCGAFDLAGACCGFLYALVMAESYANAQQRPVLLVAANILSRRINFNEHSSAVLFGDGAGAVIVMPSQRNTLLLSEFLTEANYYSLIQVRAGGSVQPFTNNMNMPDTKISLQQGKQIFKKAIELMTTASTTVLEKANLSTSEVDYFIPHQGNQRMMNNVCEQLKIPYDKMISTVDNVGNTSAANIPICLSIAYQKKPFEAGKTMLFTAAGAGMTGGAVLLTR